ncbi:MAG: bifunctional homocysteine S-methyltransferase/methylenetetrahydrofolate reductase [Longimicrobiales bacterium]|nr:bifunctional homocysteine S-methyltransferase/methylenetetrahydrofolate reductase [Longimicrobiales bacterium]
MTGGEARHTPFTLRDRITDERIHIVDGAIGSVLYERGVFLNICYDALVLEEPALVRSIHDDYVAAGAEILETNTFGANPVKLSAHGLDDRTEEINHAAVRLAREAAGGRAHVVGAVGPLGVRLEPWGPTSVTEAGEHFARQIDALLEAGADGIMLETFADLHELETALATARMRTELPIFAQITVGSDGRTPFGTDAVDAARVLAKLGADVVGLNCSVGPAGMLEAIERIADAVDLPLSALPNAGLPREVGDRKMYLASPEYMARYGRRLVELGVRFVGGCCGTTPEHTRQLARVVRGMQPRHPPPRVEALEARDEAPDPIPLAVRSGLGAALASGRFVRSLEILPPRGWTTDVLLARACEAAAHGADVVTLVDAPRGRSRMAALHAASLVQRETGVEAVAHYTCRDRNMMGMVSDLFGAAAAGVKNLILVSGDPPAQGPYPDSTAVFDIDSIGLANVVAGMNRGRDPGGAEIGGPTSFVTGVAINPNALDLRREVERTRWKVEAGADFAVTQPLFEEDALLRFLDQTRLEIPVFLGVWPLASVRNAEFLAHEVPGGHVPPRILERLSALAGDPGGAREAGIEMAVDAFTRLRDVVVGLHVTASPGEGDAALEVLRLTRSA